MVLDLYVYTGEEVMGRPKLEVKAKGRNIKAYDDEWEIIKEFAHIVKYGDKEICKEFVEKNKIVMYKHK